jgi:hypothetical protein
VTSLHQFYPNGNLCSYMKPDGSGTVYYPDGRIAVNIIAGTTLEAT